MSRRYGYNPSNPSPNQGQAKVQPPYVGGTVQVNRVVIYDVTGRPVEDKIMSPVTLTAGDTLTVNWTCPAPGNAHVAQPQSSLP